MGFKPLSHTDPQLQEHYGDLLRVFPEAKFVVDEQGTYRFQPDPLLTHLVHADPRYVDLNRLWRDLGSPDAGFDIWDMARFYQNIGYSLSGFLDVFEHRLPPLKKTAEGPDVTHTGLIPLLKIRKGRAK
jgi:hypothetical protein